MTGPVRTCVGCRAKRGQGELLRVTRRQDGTVSMDPVSIRGGGRGAYVCGDTECVEQALRTDRLRRALNAEGPLPDRVHGELMRRIGERRLG